jgi:uncharacterized protein (TIGR03437 family)
MKLSVIVLAFCIPISAFADFGESVLLQTSSGVNLETGAVGGSGLDIVWSGTTFTLQNGAKNLSLGAVGGIQAFDADTDATLAAYISAANATSIAATKLVTGALFLVVDHAGHLAKVLVLANNGSSVLIEFLTYGAPTAALPAITMVLNNSGQTPFGYPNYGISPSSLFVIQGSSLADPGAPVLQSSAAPGLPLTLNGASISVTVNAVTTHPAIYYTSPTQIAAVLPAATPIGFGAITVTYRGSASAPMQIQVVPSALGFNFYYTNTVAATDAITGALLTFTNSATPGEIITLWATGLGADPADSDSVFASPPHAVSVPLQIYFGGVPATILYQGSAGYPGVNQINVTVPPNVIPGCWVDIAGVAGGVTSNTVSLPINPGGGPCVDTPSGLTGTQVLGPNNAVLRTGLVTVLHTNTPQSGARAITNSADAAFVSYSGLYSPGNPVTAGGCILNDENVVPVPPVVGLDVGEISLSGPSGPAVTLRSQGIQGTGYAALSATAIPDTGGAFTFTMSGGKDVPGFSTSVTLANPLMTWTNPNVAAAIDRTQPLTVTWTGGNPGPHSSTFILGSTIGAVRGRGFTCLTTADAGQFTVPSYILSALPVEAPAASGFNGSVILQNNIQLPMSATGIDIGTVGATVSYTMDATIK